MKVMFALNVFEILLFEGRSILWPAQKVAGNERVNRFLKFFIPFLKVNCTFYIKVFNWGVLRVNKKVIIPAISRPCKLYKNFKAIHFEKRLFHIKILSWLLIINMCASAVGAIIMIRCHSLFLERWNLFWIISC